MKARLEQRVQKLENVAGPDEPIEVIVSLIEPGTMRVVRRFRRLPGRIIEELDVEPENAGH